MDIRKVLSSRGWTVDRLADAMGVHRNTLSYSINHSPTTSTLRKIASIIGCDMVDFFGDEIETQDYNFVMDVASCIGDTPRPYLREYLQLFGMSQKQLAARMDKSKAYISALISHKSSASVSMLNEIACILGIPFWQLFICPDASAKSKQPVYLAHDGKLYSASSLDAASSLINHLKEK